MTTSMVQCSLCKRDCPRPVCRCIETTEKERHDIPYLEREYFYCKPCWKSLSDPVSGPAIMKGMFEIMLRNSGISNAELLAARYHSWLVKNAAKPRS